MRATGIVRRIDDLGRVVIPKEIRRTMRIREGDALEIFTEREGEIILNKYSPIGELGNFAKVLHIIMIYYLKVFKERSIIYNDKSKCLRITDTAHPSPDGHFFIQIFLSVSV